MKEIKLSPNISPHDMSYRVKQANEFLRKGIQVKVTLQFKGREMKYQERGFTTLKLFLSLCEGRAQGEPRLRGKQISTVLNPMKWK